MYLSLSSSDAAYRKLIVAHVEHTSGGSPTNPDAVAIDMIYCRDVIPYSHPSGEGAGLMTRIPDPTNVFMVVIFVRNTPSSSPAWVASGCRWFGDGRCPERYSVSLPETVRMEISGRRLLFYLFAAEVSGHPPPPLSNTNTRSSIRACHNHEPSSMEHAM